MMSNIINSMNN